MQAVLRQMVADRCTGAVINLASQAGRRGEALVAHYCASKAAAISYTQSAALAMAPHGIRVNAIAPGEIDTAILSPGTDKIVETIPLRRLGETAEVADIIYFLCSPQASYVSGSEIHINGGQHV
jgi:NAD(P)-dependent dehydrogenase (short-subunit alcohol dehydrogenase family)